MASLGPIQSLLVSRARNHIIIPVGLAAARARRSSTTAILAPGMVPWHRSQPRPSYCNFDHQPAPSFWYAPFLIFALGKSTQARASSPLRDRAVWAHDPM